MSTDTPSDWSLAVIIEVDKADRVQCQCKGCGQGIYKHIHMIVWADGRIECWGSECYRRELGCGPSQVVPLYFGGGGRKLTEEERGWLTGNRERLIASFREMHEQMLREQKEREEAARLEKERQAAEAVAEVTRIMASVPDEEQPRPSRDSPPRWAAPIRPYSSSRPSRPSPPPQPTRRPPPEPLHDPLYVEVKEMLAADWRGKGIGIDRPGEQIIFLQNVAHRYEVLRRLNTNSTELSGWDQ